MMPTPTPNPLKGALTEWVTSSAVGTYYLYEFHYLDNIIILIKIIVQDKKESQRRNPRTALVVTHSVRAPL
jgi:hypothetical protein